MFSCVFRRNAKAQVTNDSSPVERTVQATSNDSTETPSGSSKRKNENSNDLVDQSSVKFKRFGLESQHSSNLWDLPSGLFSNIDKYMVIYFSDRDIKDRILETTLLPRNIKESRKLDGYIKEFLIENKKNAILTKERLLK